MAAKRSPILGYNHNVKYRGVVFHVQTEDSGLMNPHLFTHLFHEGVIVSTRKLVYDAGSNEESIKSLMQAQHKAVMKDLKKGTFDDKIDVYLSGVEGLEPRAGATADAAPLPRGERAPTEVSPAPAEAASPLEISNEDLSEPIELPLKVSRVQTGDKTRPISMNPAGPELIDENAATLAGDGAAQLAAAFRASADLARTATEQDVPPPPPVVSRTGTAPRVSRTGSAPQRGGLEIIDDEPSRGRAARDTTLELNDVGDGVPSRSTQDSIPPLTTPVRAGTPPSHGAAALPAMAKTARPSLSPQVVTRTVTGERHRPEDSEAVEIYQPAPPSVEPPPGERSERPGQYSVSRKDKSGRIAINPATVGQQAPSGLQKPGQTGNPRIVQPGAVPNRVPQGVQREPTPQNQMPRSGGPQMPRPGTPPPTPTSALRPGAPQPVRAHVTAPIQNRTPTPAPPAPGSGVVMTRPAVIVGAPPKPPQSPSSTQRIRKAREDEGRGFGQGLISEKSLDEVILAYLSEDAEDK